MVLSYNTRIFVFFSTFLGTWASISSILLQFRILVRYRKIKKIAIKPIWNNTCSSVFLLTRQSAYKGVSSKVHHSHSQFTYDIIRDTAIEFTRHNDYEEKDVHITSADLRYLDLAEQVGNVRLRC